MTAATVISFSKFRVLLGDGGDPETFTAPCGFNSRALNRAKNVNEIDIPDCDDEDAPAWVGREVRSLSWSVTGEGVLSAQSVEAWEAFFESNASKNVQVEIEMPSPVGTIVKEGAAHLTTFNIAGNRGEKVTVNVELQGDGALVTAS